MVDYTPEGRLDMVLTTIIPSVVDNLEGDFQTKQLENYEGLAYQLNDVCKIPVADLPQYFADIRELIKRKTKEVERIEAIQPMAATPNQTW